MAWRSPRLHGACGALVVRRRMARYVVDLLRRHQVHALQEGIVGGEIAEQVDQGLGDPEAHGEELVAKSRLGDRRDQIGMVLEARAAERLAGTATPKTRFSITAAFSV